jgi:hypothetical protein
MAGSFADLIAKTDCLPGDFIDRPRLVVAFCGDTFMGAGPAPCTVRSLRACVLPRKGGHQAANKTCRTMRIASEEPAHHGRAEFTVAAETLKVTTTVANAVAKELTRRKLAAIIAEVRSCRSAGAAVEAVALW